MFDKLTRLSTSAVTYWLSLSGLISKISGWKSEKNNNKNSTEIAKKVVCFYESLV